MGSKIETNDTLQITSEQGFPKDLVLEKHLENPYKAEDFLGKVFEFKNKDGIRIFQIPPVRNFLVENRKGKWIYWGLCHIVETNHDYLNKITSGKFKIIYINSPEEMKKAYDLIDRRLEKNYFA
jgi:hypothetical protein